MGKKEEKSVQIKAKNLSPDCVCAQRKRKVWNQHHQKPSNETSQWEEERKKGLQPFPRYSNPKRRNNGSATTSCFSSFKILESTKYKSNNHDNNNNQNSMDKERWEYKVLMSRKKNVQAKCRKTKYVQESSNGASRFFRFWIFKDENN